MASIIAAETATAMMTWFVLPVHTKENRKIRMTSTIYDLEEVITDII